MFTKEELKKFRIDFSEAVKGLEEYYKIKIEMGSISFNANEFHAKLISTRTDDTGNKQIDQRYFEVQKNIYGLKGNLGDSFSSKGIILTISSINTRKRKNNVILSGNDGKQYMASPEYVNKMLGK
jgi:hypothetical protein